MFEEHVLEKIKICKAVVSVLTRTWIKIVTW